MEKFKKYILFFLLLEWCIIEILQTTYRWSLCKDICAMRLMLLLHWLMMSGTRSTTTIDVSRPNAFGSSMPILLMSA